MAKAVYGGTKATVGRGGSSNFLSSLRDEELNISPETWTSKKRLCVTRPIRMYQAYMWAIYLPLCPYRCKHCFKWISGINNKLFIFLDVCVGISLCSPLKNQNTRHQVLRKLQCTETTTTIIRYRPANQKEPIMRKTRLRFGSKPRKMPWEIDLGFATR